jgi:hypothetical protein
MNLFSPGIRCVGLFACLLCPALFLSSCGDDEVVEPRPQDDFRYFPLATGYWTEYSVDSIVHLPADDADEIDTAITSYHFFVREEVDSSYIDSENKKNFVIVRYKRDNDTLPWELINVWTAKIDAYSAQRVEDNIRFVRLKFPITPTTYWNGNAYNYYPVEEYGYSRLFQAAQYGTLTFDSTVTVNQNNFVSNINRIRKNEVYAAGVGLLYKELDSVRTKNTAQGTIILNGFEFRQQITDYKQ